MPRKRCIFGIVKPTKILAVMKITPAVPKPLSNSDIYSAVNSNVRVFFRVPIYPHHTILHYNSSCLATGNYYNSIGKKETVTGT